MLNSFKSFASIILLLGLQIPASIVFAQVNNVNGNVCPGDLKNEIEEIINQPKLRRSRWGILVESLNQDNIIYEREADRYFVPASNAKLLTTAAILRQLGADFKFRTVVYGKGDLPDLKTLTIVGQADPSFTSLQLEELVKQLKERGIKSVDNLILDNSYLGRVKTPLSWEWDDLYTDYAAPVSSFILNGNAVTLKISPSSVGKKVKVNWSDSLAGKQWRINNQARTNQTGTPSKIEIESSFTKPELELKGNLALDASPDEWGLSIINPEQYFLDSLRAQFLKAGIIVKKANITDKKIQELGAQLALIESQPLSLLLKKANQDSDNLYAETFWRILEREGLEKQLTELGIEVKSYILRDGSGLSRQNLVTPKALVQTLKFISKTPQGEIYQQSLAVAGINGTLKKRFANTEIEGNLQGKTGTISQAVTLSGYLNVPNYQTLVFTILVNQSELPASVLRENIDRIIFLMMKLQDC